MEHSYRYQSTWSIVTGIRAQTLDSVLLFNVFLAYISLHNVDHAQGHRDVDEALKTLITRDGAQARESNTSSGLEGLDKMDHSYKSCRQASLLEEDGAQA